MLRFISQRYTIQDLTCNLMVRRRFHTYISRENLLAMGFSCFCPLHTSTSSKTRQYAHMGSALYIFHCRHDSDERQNEKKNSSVYWFMVERQWSKGIGHSRSCCCFCCYQWLKKRNSSLMGFYLSHLIIIIASPLPNYERIFEHTSVLITQKFEQIHKGLTEGREVPKTLVWIELREVKRTGVRKSRVINLVGCRQTEFSVCWFIKNTMREWNSNGVRKFQLDSKFYCRQFFFRTRAHTNTQTNTPTLTRTSALHNGKCVAGKSLTQTHNAEETQYPFSVWTGGLLVYFALENSIDAIHLLSLMHSSLHTMSGCRWYCKITEQVQINKINSQVGTFS